MKLQLSIIILLQTIISSLLYCNDSIATIIKELLVLKKVYKEESFSLKEKKILMVFPKTTFHNLIQYDTPIDFAKHLLRINKKDNKKLNRKNIILVPYKKLKIKSNNEKIFYLNFVQGNCILSEKDYTSHIDKLNKIQLFEKTGLKPIKEDFFKEVYPETDSEYESDNT
jgi:hypothetical protein